MYVELAQDEFAVVVHDRIALYVFGRLFKDTTSFSVDMHPGRLHLRTIRLGLTYILSPAPAQNQLGSIVCHEADVDSPNAGGISPRAPQCQPTGFG